MRLPTAHQCLQAGVQDPKGRGWQSAHHHLPLTSLSIILLPQRTQCKLVLPFLARGYVDAAAYVFAGFTANSDIDQSMRCDLTVYGSGYVFRACDCTVCLPIEVSQFSHV